MSSTADWDRRSAVARSEGLPIGVTCSSSGTLRCQLVRSFPAGGDVEGERDKVVAVLLVDALDLRDVRGRSGFIAGMTVLSP